MDADSSKLRQRQSEDALVQPVHGAKTGPLEFQTPEEMLRHDASQTPVPDSIPARLQESLRGEPKPRLSWWRRWFSRS